MPSLISIANQALDEVGGVTIASMDESNIEARSIKRHLPTVLSEFLEWHEWGAAIRRTALALRSSNDRRNEWQYAYALPPDFGTARRVVPALTGDTLEFPVIGPFVYPAWDALGPVPFLIDNATLYTNLENAIFEYGVNEIEPAQITAMMARAIALETAARIAMPIKKSRELKGDLIKQAEVARTRAIADDENRYPRQSIRYVSESEWARAGYGYGSAVAPAYDWRG